MLEKKKQEAARGVRLGGWMVVIRRAWEWEKGGIFMGRVSSVGAISGILLSDVLMELDMIRRGAGPFKFVVSRSFCAATAEGRAFRQTK